MDRDEPMNFTLQIHAAPGRSYEELRGFDEKFPGIIPLFQELLSAALAGLILTREGLALSGKSWQEGTSVPQAMLDVWATKPDQMKLGAKERRFEALRTADWAVRMFELLEVHGAASLGDMEFKGPFPSRGDTPLQ